jgi:hypothetical protein
MATDEDSRVVFVQDRQWFGNPRLGAFVASLDGERVGVVGVRGSLRVHVPSGRHVARVRQWWYRSPPMTLEVRSRETLTLKADVDRSRGLMRAMARSMFMPWKALTLSPQRQRIVP